MLIFFQIMPMLIYIGAVMSILYYLGVTQVIAGKMGWFMQICLKTTAIETLAIAANIFLNGVSKVSRNRNHKIPFFLLQNVNVTAYSQYSDARWSNNGELQCPTHKDYEPE